MTFWEGLAGGRSFVADLGDAKPRRALKIRTARYSSYEAFDPARGVRPRCYAHGCSKHLRRDQRFACCPEHEKRVREQLALLDRLVNGGD